MQTNTFLKFGAFLAVVLAGSNVHAQAKLGQTGFQFLSVGSDARAGAMGEAITTLEMGSSSLFFNPAGMATMPGFLDAMVSQNNWIADIKHNSYSLALNPRQGRYGVLGFSIMSVDYGEIQGTMVWPNDQGYIDTELLEPTAVAMGIGYAKSLSDKFSVGGQVKLVSQYLAKSVIPTTDTTYAVKKNLADGVAFDFGTIFKTGFRSLVFGMSVRNFSSEIKYASEGFQLPLTFKIGLSANLFELLSLGGLSQPVFVSVDASHPRAFSEQLNIGVEYKVLNMLALRGGYLYNYDERGATFGFGLQKFGLAIDYAYMPFGDLGTVQRFTVRFSS